MKISSKLTILPVTIALCAALGAASTPAFAQGQADGPRITDATEYAAYVAALNEKDPKAQIAALEAFLAKYPKTVVKQQALEVELAAEPKAGSTLADMNKTAHDLLGVNPNHERARLIVSAAFLQTPMDDKDPQFASKLADEEANAKAGIEGVNNLKRPENVSDADFQATKNVTLSTHYQALANISQARKDTNGAIENLKKAGALSPNDAGLFYRLGEFYRLSAATPGLSDDEKRAKLSLMLYGYARSVGIDGAQALAPAGKQQVDAYLATTYKQYHGSDDGLAKLKDDAKATALPPADFHIMSKAEMAKVEADKAAAAAAADVAAFEAKIPADPAQMTFLQISYVLGKNDDRAKATFAKLKGTAMELDGKIVKFTPAKTLKLAVGKATQATEGVSDVTVVLVLAPLAARVAPGKAVSVQGVVKDFTAEPFSLTLDAGKIMPAAAAKKP